MTQVAFERITFISNPNGIMAACNFSNLSEIVNYNRRLYFYKYDIYDLVEVKYSKEENIIYVYDLYHSPDNTRVYFGDSIVYLEGYFKCAGLSEKRFLFDMSLKMPVNYTDFEYVENPDLSSPFSIFILDKKDGGYITDPGVVNVYAATSNNKETNNCILAAVNSSILISKPKELNKFSSLFVSMLCGVQSNIEITDLLDEMRGVENSGKFLNAFDRLEFTSDFVDRMMMPLKIKKFNELMHKIIPQEIAIDENMPFSGDEVLASFIIKMGLDAFLRLVKNPERKINVYPDIAWQEIKSAYIIKGCMFVSPGAVKRVNWFRDLMNSENVELVLN